MHVFSLLFDTIIQQNALWDVANSDPYRALSWERLHAFLIGLFGKHLWPELKARVKKAGRKALALVDTQCVDLLMTLFLFSTLTCRLDRMAAVPPWRGLNHFPQILSVSFNDGRKFEDMSKVREFAHSDAM